MQQHTLPQGSPEWHAHRRQHFNASDAPAMLGCSPYKTREQLLRELATGRGEEHDEATQRRFADGHRYEALARPLAEEIIGEPLYPVVGTSGRYSASFDGLTMVEDTAFEHKSLNAELRAALQDCIPELAGATLPKHYRVQMEHQCMVAGCERVLFMASKWEGEQLVASFHCWYYPDAELRAELISGWQQFEADLQVYEVPDAPAPQPVAAKKASLPALVVDVKGEVVQSNLAEWKGAAIAHIQSINTTLVSDQDFADASEAVKWCESSKTRLQEVKAAAIARMRTVEELFSTIDEIVGTMDAKRLSLSKLIEARKEARKKEIVDKGVTALNEHVRALEQRLLDALPEGTTVKGALMPVIASDFWAAVKGKRNFALMESAVSDEAARCKVLANQACELREKNLKTLAAKAKDHKHLFADWRELIAKDAELVDLTIGQRIQAEKDAEERRLADDRERIRQEEEVRARAQAQREQQEREAAERRQREAQEVAARAEKRPDSLTMVALDVAEQERANEERLQRAAEQRLHDTSQQLQASAQPLPGLSVPAANVRPMPTRAPAPSSPPTLRLGEIQKRIAPLSIDAAGLAALGFPHAKQEGAAKLWHEHQFRAICDALIASIAAARDQRTQAAACPPTTTRSPSMEKRKFPEPQAFSKNPRPHIALHGVESSQVKAIGHDPATNTLAVQFNRSPAVYHYPGVSREQFEAFKAAESIGAHFGKHFKHLPFEKYALEGATA